MGDKKKKKFLATLSSQDSFILAYLLMMDTLFIYVANNVSMNATSWEMESNQLYLLLVQNYYKILTILKSYVIKFLELAFDMFKAFYDFPPFQKSAVLILFFLAVTLVFWLYSIYVNSYKNLPDQKLTTFQSFVQMIGHIMWFVYTGVSWFLMWMFELLFFPFTWIINCIIGMPGLLKKAQVYWEWMSPLIKIKKKKKSKSWSFMWDPMVNLIIFWTCILMAEWSKDYLFQFIVFYMSNALFFFMSFMFDDLAAFNKLSDWKDFKTKFFSLFYSGSMSFLHFLVGLWMLKLHYLFNINKDFLDYFNSHPEGFLILTWILLGMGLTSSNIFMKFLMMLHMYVMMNMFFPSIVYSSVQYYGEYVESLLGLMSKN